MGDEEIKIWLDEYNKTMGNSSIDFSDYYSAIDDNTYTIGLSDNDWIYPQEPAHDDITLTGGGEEMLRIDKDGFYVRGVRVEADAKEAEQVYRAFKQWLTWAHLSRHGEE